MSSWAQTLDECEARLDAAEVALEATTSGTPAAAGISFPETDGAEPLPAELLDRAVSLVRRSAELEARLETERDRVSHELRRLPRARTAHVSPDSHFELKA